MSFPCGSPGKESACNAGDLGSIPGSGRSLPGGQNGNPLQYSCLGNPMHKGARRVHGVAKSWTAPSDKACLSALRFIENSLKQCSPGTPLAVQC